MYDFGGALTREENIINSCMDFNMSLVLHLMQPHLSWSWSTHTKSAVQVFMLLSHALVWEAKQTMVVNWAYVRTYQYTYIKN